MLLRKKKAIMLAGAALLAAAVFASTATSVADASISGIQLRSQVWEGTIRIVEDTYFAPWATLRIKPGTKVLFEKRHDVEGTEWTKYADEFIRKHGDPTGREGYGKTHYTLSGKISALGTKDSPIIFTSAQAKPEYADWDQLVLLGGSRLEYVELAYAHNGANIDGDGVVIRNSKLHDSLWSCIDIFSTDNLIENNEVYHCWHQGIGVKKAGANLIRNNYVHDAQLSVNCEYGAKPTISGNRFRAAPLNPDCGEGSGNKEEPGEPDTIGGTYNGALIYPAKEKGG